MANTKGQIFGINGPVVKVKGSDSFEMQEMVYVGNEGKWLIQKVRYSV